MKRVVLDTNIYISAILFGGKPETIWKKVKRGEVQIFISKAILQEISSVLRRKFDWETSKIKKVLEEVEDFTFLVIPKESVSIIAKHKADNRILECALEAKADFLISGDRHLLSLESFLNVKIVDPSSFLKEK